MPAFLQRLMRHARRPLRWLLWIVVALVAVPLVLLAAALVALNTAPGQAFLAAEVGPLSGGLVTVSGLRGTLPVTLRVRHIAIADRQGVWCSIDDAALHWSPLALLAADAHIDSLEARRVAIARLPVSQSAQPGRPFQLPLRVDVDRAHVGELAVAASVAGVPAALELDASAHLAKLFQGRAALTATDLDAAGSYRVEAELRPATVRVTLDAREPAGGLVARLAKLPSRLGGLSVQAALDGPRDAAVATLALAAGPAHADAHGTIDLEHRAADLTLAAAVPAMAPAPGLSFQSASVAGQVQGTLDAPRARMDLRLRDVAAGKTGASDLAATVDVTPDRATLTATAAEVRLPGPRPDLLAADPVVLTARVAVKAPGRPVQFTLRHPLLNLSGEARTAEPLSVSAHLDAPELAPLAAAAGVDLHGHAALDLAGARSGATTRVTLGGTLGLTAAPPPLSALIGPDARIDLAAALHGQDVTLSRFEVDGQALTLTAHGTLAAGRLDASADATLPDLHAAAATLTGSARLHAQATGPLDQLAVQARLAGDVGTRGVPKGHVEARLDATGLPAAPSGTLTADGRLDGSPLEVDAAVTRTADGAIAADIRRADWKGAHAEARLALAPGAVLPSGTASLRVRSLADFRRLSGLALTGSVDGRFAVTQAEGRPVLTATLRADRAGLPGQAAIRRLALDARVSDPLGELSVAATLAAEGVRAGAVVADAHATISGPRTALAIRADAAATGVAGGPARVATRASVNLAAHVLSLAALDVAARGETLRLLAPAHVSFGPIVAVDRLRLGLRQAVLDVAGRVSPTLDLTARLDHATADLARIADPSLDLQGTLSAQARLTGTPTRPTGTLRVAARGLRLRRGPTAGLPPADVTADAALAGRTARVDAAVSAGTTQFAVSGTAPITPGAALDLHATGAIDLAVTDPVLTPAGRRARGRIALDATVTGTPAAPRASGTLTLAGGAFEDLGQGFRLGDLDALIAAEGDHVTLRRLTGRAGPGTISASGSIGLAAPRPVDFRLVLDHAQPIANDVLSAVLSADLTLRGALQGGLAANGRIAASGRIGIERASITVPDKLPSSVAVLDVRVPGQQPPPPPAPPPDIGLDVSLSAPAVIFVRGHGLDAVLRGDLHAGGSTAHPQISGGFDMIHGTLSVAGTSLTFSTGKVTFDGSGKLDPVLDFLASGTSGSVTANLEVTGYASDPKIRLSSTPALPPDEVLSHLLFGQSAASLSPFQLGEIALALAQLTGAPGSGIDPLGAARKALGLDRLQVLGGSGGSSSGATLQAGQYVAPGIYVGAAQGTGGGSTQAQVQIDITKGLKLDTTVGTGGGSATGASQSTSSGTSIGLTYQFQY